MEVGRSWPFPAEWGTPAPGSPAWDSPAEASRWILGKIGEHRAPRRSRRLWGREARELLQTRLDTETRQREVELVGKRWGP